MVAMLSVGFISCGGDDDQDNESTGDELVTNKECGIKDVGKISKITDITSKDIFGGEGQDGNYLRYHSTFQPSHGYIINHENHRGGRYCFL